MTRLVLLVLFILVHAVADARPVHRIVAKTFAHREDVRTFVADMQTRHGFDATALQALFDHTQVLPTVIQAVKPPRDPGVRSWKKYRAGFVEPKRIAAGRRFMEANAAALASAESQYGVPGNIVAAIIGVETIYGRHKGRYGTFAVLATLAFDYPPRAELFRQELEELLLLARDEGRDPLSYAGSFAGAFGVPQFMPSSRRKYAIDYDGDGKVDLDDSLADVIGSVANFLNAHGWVKGGPIATTVQVYSGDEGQTVQALLNEGIVPRRTPGNMTAQGVRLLPLYEGSPAFPEEPAALIDLVTPKTPTEYRLGYKNFYVITRYNRSSFYAASVMDLATELATASE